MGGSSGGAINFITHWNWNDERFTGINAFDALLELPFCHPQHTKGGREKLPGQQRDGYKPRRPIFDKKSELCADPSRSECLIFGSCASLFFM